MSQLVADFDEKMWEKYLTDLQLLSQDYEKSPALKPSLKDFHVWLQDQEYDEDEHER